MNDAIPDNLVIKVQKLLRVATSSNQHEAELAMSHAKRLCVEYDLDLASISAFSPKESDEPIIQSSEIPMGKRLPVAEKYVCHIIQGFFNTKLVYHGNRSQGQRVTFIGKKKDIEISSYVYSLFE